MSSSVARYLILFQYCGTRYSGVMAAPDTQAVRGVQNYLELAAQKLKPEVPIRFFISSRTDSGVHALCNSAHIDIQRTNGKPPFSENILANALNYHLKPEPISVLKVYRVPPDFHARYRAVARTYMYRLVTGCPDGSHLPVFERNLCWPLQSVNLDVAAMQEAAQVLLGTHDFSTFRSPSSDAVSSSPVKTLDQVEVAPACGRLMPHQMQRKLQFWEVTFKSRSFLYKQVRRMTGILVSVGQGRLTPSQVKELLEIRDTAAFPGNAMAPPDGLFLKNVEYDGIDQ
ncbi:tRNA pseudouridine synthase-like 1 [Ambystoma mexicanum]|uniref:tRNA pseudouridine synthase-like 1 n=1 Tax=Ambystoma mexicanum TaxID=8296 RepID=UPI0037E793AE